MTTQYALTILLAGFAAGIVSFTMGCVFGIWLHRKADSGAPMLDWEKVRHDIDPPDDYTSEPPPVTVKPHGFRR